MTCREHDLSSAITSYGRISSGLRDRQEANIFHRLMDEGEGMLADGSIDQDPPNAYQLQKFIEEQREIVAACPNLSTKRRTNIEARLAEASRKIDAGEAKPVSPALFYALQRFSLRAKQAKTDFDKYLDNAARDLGMTRNEATVLFDQYQQEAIQNKDLTADPAWVEQFDSSSAGDSAIPKDRTSLYAYQQIEQRRAASKVLQPVKRTVNLEPVNDEKIALIGYNPDENYMEIEFHARPGRQYSYQITPEDYHEFRNATNLEAYYQSQIRGNPKYTFSTPEEWNAAKESRRCPSCGKYYSGMACTCPVRGSVEERNRTVQLARAGILGSSADLPAETKTLPDPARWRRYENTNDGSENTIRTVGLTELQTAARAASKNDGGAVDTVLAPIQGTSIEKQAEYHQTGYIYARYLGYGQGYFVGAVTDPDETATRSLKCDCPEYRENYSCKHIRALVADTANRMNADLIKNPDDIPAERRTNPDDLRPSNYQVGVAWNPEESSWLEEPSLFYETYQDGKTAHRQGKLLGEYHLENATAGMASRETGRPFGIELEFQLPKDYTESQQKAAIAAIGKALYGKNLTKSMIMQNKSDFEGEAYPDEHEHGWRFINDETCSGEIVSPLMWDEPETWENIQAVTNIIKKYGGTATINTGFHVHVSTADFKDSTPVSRIIENFNNNEDIIMRLAANPRAGRHRGTLHCMRNRTPAIGTIPIGEVRLSQTDENTDLADSRNVAINMLGIRGDASDHIEYRIYDGSLDPQTIQNQINLSLALTQDGMRDTTTPVELNSGYVGTNYAKNEDKTITEADSRPFRAFLDRLFWRDQEKEALTGLFAANKWQPSA